MVGAARSEKAPGYENLKENFTVATIVELVSRCVKELEHSIEVHADLRGRNKIEFGLQSSSWDDPGTDSTTLGATPPPTNNNTNHPTFIPLEMTIEYNFLSIV